MGSAIAGTRTVPAARLVPRTSRALPLGAVRPEALTAEALFDRLADRYDATNTALSLGLDAWWRDEAAAALALEPGDLVLDICAGTLRLSDAILRREPGARVVAIDRARHMLAIGNRREDPRRVTVQACALSLPFASASFDGAAVAFGLRNLPDVARGLAEAHRVLRPGARLAVLDFVHPSGALDRAVYVASVRFLVPLVGGVLGGDPGAYRYLARSIGAFADLGGLERLVASAGFRVVESRALWPRGPAALVVGEAT